MKDCLDISFNGKPCSTNRDKSMDSARELGDNWALELPILPQSSLLCQQRDSSVFGCGLVSEDERFPYLGSTRVFSQRELNLLSFRSIAKLEKRNTMDEIEKEKEEQVEYKEEPEIYRKVKKKVLTDLKAFWRGESLNYPFSFNKLTRTHSGGKKTVKTKDLGKKLVSFGSQDFGDSFF